VCIEVCDDGPGVARELRERVFQPFETTRPNGTGLGLALARHSVELHQGWIRIDEAPGGGACVRFWLPVAGPSALPEERHQALVPEERHVAALSEARGEE
jgi:two-component system sensor kinase FixL